MKFDEQNSITLDVISYQLDLSNYVNMIIWDEDDKSMAEKLLQAVLSSTPPAPHKIAAVSEDSPNH